MSHNRSHLTSTCETCLNRHLKFKLKTSSSIRRKAYLRYDLNTCVSCYLILNHLDQDQVQIGLIETTLLSGSYQLQSYLTSTLWALLQNSQSSRSGRHSLVTKEWKKSRAEWWEWMMNEMMTDTDNWQTLRGVMLQSGASCYCHWDFQKHIFKNLDMQGIHTYTHTHSSASFVCAACEHEHENIRKERDVLSAICSKFWSICIDLFFLRELFLFSKQIIWA